ncbi:hypothetical protein RIMD111065_19260 [Aeromonas hydrophila]|nr:hypothetical protein RIMD111065_19260 [Aeromonas hydrophila]
MNTKILLMLSLTISTFVYGAAYDTYRLESQEIKGKNRICYYENVRGEGHTITQPKAKQCKQHIKLN